MIGKQLKGEIHDTVFRIDGNTTNHTDQTLIKKI